MVEKIEKGKIYKLFAIPFVVLEIEEDIDVLRFCYLTNADEIHTYSWRSAIRDFYEYID